MVESKSSGSKMLSGETFTAVLLGKEGVGKTTIYNLLCNTSHPVG